jgi:hypothetical protein
MVLLVGQEDASAVLERNAIESEAFHLEKNPLELRGNVCPSRSSAAGRRQVSTVARQTADYDLSTEGQPIRLLCLHGVPTPSVALHCASDRKRVVPTALPPRGCAGDDMPQCS